MRSLPFVIAALAVAMVACAPAAPSPTSTPPKPAATPAPAKPATSPEAKPAASPAAKPAAKPAAEAKPPPEWDQALAAARQEGKVAVAGPTGADRRDVLVVPFQEKYGISVDYFGDEGAGIPPRVSAERAAGQYLWDVVVAGTTIGLTGLIPIGALAPLEPALILPEVKGPANWRGGALEFLDERRHYLAMTPSQRATLFVKPDVIKPGDLRSYKDLLDARYTRKIVAHDPRTSGPGQATFLFFYLHPELGPDFIRALAQQELVLLRDYNQLLDGVARGSNLVAIGVSDVAAEERQRAGVPIAPVDPHTLREGSDVSPAAGNVGLFDKAPHPNAAKVYINWLLSKDGQADFARVNGYISGRLDVPTDHSPWRVPIPGAVKTYTLEALEVRTNKLVPLLKEVFGQ